MNQDVLGLPARLAQDLLLDRPALLFGLHRRP
jgi:hypothetical protein